MPVKSRPTTPQREEPVWKWTVGAEQLRFVAYLGFWSMVLLARTLSTRLVVPMLAAGPEKEGDVCGPFNREDKGFGIGPGQPFKFPSESHLAEFFGFPNVCTNWDYSPAREITAMYYPVFEYSLMVYLCLDFVVTTLAYKRGELSEWFWKFSKIVFPLNILLCSQFRMIFVCIAYEAVQQHTAGFLCLQVALILVATQNTLYIICSGQGYDFLGGTKNTARVAMTYLVLLLIISSFKITATIYVVGHAVGAPWTLKASGIGDLVVGRVVDLIWMVFNAGIPLLVAYIRAKNEAPLEIVITCPNWDDYVDSDETAPLAGGAASHTKYETYVQEAI